MDRAEAERLAAMVATAPDWRVDAVWPPREWGMDPRGAFHVVRITRVPDGRSLVLRLAADWAFLRSRQMRLI